MFEQVDLLPADPILGLIEAYNQDTRSNKVDLGVGVYKDPQGNTPILESVKLAEAHLLKTQITKSYIGSHGDPVFGTQMLELIFGANSPVLDAGRATLTQAVGGTGALRLAADFLQLHAPQKKVWIPKPSWPNHQAIAKAANLAVGEYTYVNEATNSLDFAGMLADFQQIPHGDVVILHACCHNPSGFDLNHSQWREILAVIQERELLPLLDSAYQGFGDGLEEDAFAIRLLSENLDELMLASSCSKNFGVYRERIGAFVGVAKNSSIQEKLRSQMASIARANYSNPPAHGGALVATILQDADLNKLWRSEADSMRINITSLREQLVTALEPFSLAQRFACITQQKGMFSYTGLQPHEVKSLREDFAIYMAGNGRINIAGYNANNIDYLCQALAQVCQQN